MPPLKIHKQEEFAQQYALHGNGTRAAIAAGYAEAGAAVVGSRLAKDPNVRRRIDELRQRVTASKLARVAADQAWVMEKLVENAEAALEAKDRGSANRALELIGKELGMFVDRKMDVTDPLAALSAEQLQALVRLADQLGEGPTQLVLPPAAKSVIYPQPSDIIELSASSGAAEADPAPDDAPEDDVL